MHPNIFHSSLAPFQKLPNITVKAVGVAWVSLDIEIGRQQTMRDMELQGPAAQGTDGLQRRVNHDAQRDLLDFLIRGLFDEDPKHYQILESKQGKAALRKNVVKWAAATLKCSRRCSASMDPPKDQFK